MKKKIAIKLSNEDKTARTHITN